MGDKPGMIRLITVSEFADSLGVSPRTVAREMNDGAITVVRVRGRVQATIDQRRGVIQRLKALGAADADIDYLKAELK